MPRLPIIVLCAFAFPSALLQGCDSSPAMARPALHVVTLPSREAQATIHDDLMVVHDAALRCVRDELGYEITTEKIDERTRTARIDAAKPDGASVRIESKANRDFETTLVQVFAVDAGSTTGNAQRAGDIVDRIDAMLWGSGK
jgi:hypothetical protein